jgi:hypothetical protein
MYSIKFNKTKINVYYMQNEQRNTIYQDGHPNIALEEDSSKNKEEMVGRSSGAGTVLNPNHNMTMMLLLIMMIMIVMV